MRVLLIGKSSGRLDCLAEAISRSARTELFILTNLVNDGLSQKGFVTVGPTDDLDFISGYAEKLRGPAHTVAMISNEEPLAAGVADILNAMDVPTIGPTKALAQIESSKIFTRQLLDKYNIVGSPNWGAMEIGDMNRVETFMHAFQDFVIKPDGLTGGKGVRVRGDHFHTLKDGLAYCQEIFDSGSRLLIEQKHVGQEFSLMSFSDGNSVIDMPLVQDHKRLLDLDFGPNTGGMGSYSDVNHSLPICSKFDLHHASHLNRKVISALQEEIGQPYKGILYANYMVTAYGLKIIEYNARFGDPEVMNVLPLLETDFGDILFSIVRGNLRREQVRFARKATVCKYLVPIGHPTEPQPGTLDLSNVPCDNLSRLYRGALDGNTLTGSRAAAVVGIADDIYTASKFADHAAEQAVGPVFYRRDIGTYEAIQRKIADVTRMREWCNN